MASIRKMQPETRQQVREGLLAQTEAENRGFEQASEGQLNPILENNTDPDGPEQEIHQINDIMIMRPSLQDRPNEDAVKETQETVMKQTDERRRARRENRASEVEPGLAASRPRGAAKEGTKGAEKSAGKGASKGAGSTAKAERETARNARKTERDANKPVEPGTGDTVGGGQT